MNLKNLIFGKMTVILRKSVPKKEKSMTFLKKSLTFF